MYYITVMNEKYTMPGMPENVEEGILKGHIPFQKVRRKNRQQGSSSRKWSDSA
jgi:pyruvate dehydrogenase complex dehydrogenase (E1) component